MSNRDRRTAQIKKTLEDLSVVRGRHLSNYRASRISDAIYDSLTNDVTLDEGSLLARFKQSLLACAPTTILVTGAAGFIGSHLCRLLLTEHQDYRVVGVDSLTYAGNKRNICDLADQPRFTFVQGDIRNQRTVENLFQHVDIVINCAAQTHVDRIEYTNVDFLDTNFLAVQQMLTIAASVGIELLLHVSSYEVYGATETEATEESQLNARNPYAISKMFADKVLLQHSTDVPTIIARLSNVYGSYQHPEKFIPLCITNALDHLPLPLFGGGTNEREWTYIDDVCRAIDIIVHKGVEGEVYNVGAGTFGRTSNEAIATYISFLQEMPHEVRRMTDRPFHALRLFVDSTKLKSLGWQPTIPLRDGLAKTSDWYSNHRSWWQPLKQDFARSELGIQRYGLP